jgi:hypothetical protein
VTIAFGKGMKVGIRQIMVVLCLAFVAAMAFFSFTDTAWQWMGRPNEAYPELMFLAFGLPISIVLLLMSVFWKR